MSADRMYARRVNATPMTGVAVRGMVVAYATLAALTAACGDTAVTSVGAAKPVVRAYLYAGQPVNDIQLGGVSQLVRAILLPPHHRSTTPR